HPKVDVNAEHVFDMSPLHIAAHGGDSSESVIRKLIGKGAKMSTRTNKGETPLHIASRGGNAEAVTILLTFGADPMDGDFNGFNALHYAAQNGHLGIIQTAGNHVPDTSLETFMKSKDNHGENVLHHLLSNKVKVDIIAVDYLL
ncbi:hypothetical protein ACHAPT_013339, partial [Fusarium lateritium]